MRKVALKGISRHGKNRIREHGELWEVTSVSDVVQFSTKAVGPFLHLRSMITDDWRIISEVNDLDFEIVKDSNGS